MRERTLRNRIRDFIHRRRLPFFPQKKEIQFTVQTY